MIHQPPWTPQVAVPTVAPASAPKLLWIRSKPDGAGILPDPREECSKESPGTIIPEFLAAVRTAKKRVWILDKHFSYWGGLHNLRPALEKSVAPQVVILTAHCKAIRDETRSDPLPRRIALLGLPGGQVHDRFAIVDDNLWHWGATVGGGHELLNVVTFGWTDEVEKFACTFLSLSRLARTLEQKNNKRRA